MGCSNRARQRGNPVCHWHRRHAGDDMRPWPVSPRPHRSLLSSSSAA